MDAERRGGGGGDANDLASIPSEFIAMVEVLKGAIKRGSIAQVKKFFRKNRFNTTNSMRLVQYAVTNGAPVDMIRFLAKAFPQDLRMERFPLHLAFFAGRWDVVEALAEASPEAVAAELPVGDMRFLPLHWAVFRNAPLSVVEILTMMQPGALQVTMPPHRQLPLHLAAGKECRIETLLFLLDKYEMGLRVASASGFLPLHTAIYNHSGLEKVKAIADRYPQALFTEADGGLPPLHLAALVRSPLAVVQFLAYKLPKAVLHKSSIGALALYTALYHGTPDVVDFLARMTGACKRITVFLSQHVRAHLRRRRLVTTLQARRRGAVAYKRYGHVIRSRVQFIATWSSTLEFADKHRQDDRGMGPDWPSWREMHYDMERCLRADVLQDLEEAGLDRHNDDNIDARDGEYPGDPYDVVDEDYVAFEMHKAILPSPILSTNRVLLTNDVLKWCRTGDPKYVGFFVRRVEQLASGQRSRILAKRLKGGFKAVIFETYLEQKSGHRILWTAEALGEVLIWHVVAHKDVTRFASLIDSSLGRSSRQLSEAMSTLGIGDSATKNAISHANAIVLDSLGNTPLKLYTVSSHHVPRLADPAWTPPLRLTPEERVVVEASGTTLVLGRSGTGKTICLCSKIDFDRHLIGYSTPYTQLFVARSSKLRNFVKNAVSSDTCNFSTFDELILKLEQSVSIQSSFPSCRRVDFARFKRDFHRDPKHWGGVEALVVWTNIRSFIKGSIDALSSPEMVLSNDAYLSVEKLGKKRCRLPPEQRQGVYKAFIAYSKYLEENRLWDDCDRITHLIQRLNSLKETDPDGFESLRYSKVYVDECQDFTQVEILLFFFLSRSGDLFLCGDPAQSVVEGVQFRFKEVRSVAHFASGTSHGCGVPQKPRTLNVNYRSHSGIMKIAAAVQKRMTQFFPDEANLQDRGLFVGPRPDVVFEADLETLKGALSSRLGGSAILVHDEQKALCKQQLDGYKLVYGIRESKGLEFKSVILFDFFSGIPNALQKPWRDLLQGNEVADFASRFPEMEGQLKLLYTAITRSVDRLLFIESKQSTAGEAFVRWSTTRTTRVQVQSDDEQALAVLQKVDDVDSLRMTVDEWALAGFDSATAAEEAADLESSSTFLEAARHCFQKAGDNRLVKKVQVHLSSVQLRAQISNAEACTLTERAIADHLLQLLQEGLWTEAANLTVAALPHLPEYTQNQLRETFLPKLPSV